MCQTLKITSKCAIGYTGRKENTMKEIAFMIYDTKNPKRSEIVAYVDDRDIALAKQKGYKIKQVEREKGENHDNFKRILRNHKSQNPHKS